MERKEIYQAIKEIFNACELNYVKEEVAIKPSLAGLQLFEEPLVKFGSVNDELFLKYKEPGVIGPWFDGPEVWLAEGKTVISLFFPFTEVVKNQIEDAQNFHLVNGFMEELKDRHVLQNL